MQQYVSFKDLLTFREHLDDVVTVTTCIRAAHTRGKGGAMLCFVMLEFLASM